MTVPTATWVLPRPRGDYFPGSFPLHFEKKLWRLVGEPRRVLHPFGGLAEIGDSIDLNETTLPTFVGDAHDLTKLIHREDGAEVSLRDETYDLVICDPPYSNDECDWIYGISTPLKRSKWVAEAVRVTKTGGHVALYHRNQPARPKGTKLVQRIVVLTRTGHSARLCFVYQKMTPEEQALFAQAAQPKKKKVRKEKA